MARKYEKHQRRLEEKVDAIVEELQHVDRHGTWTRIQTIGTLIVPAIGILITYILTTREQKQRDLETFISAVPNLAQTPSERRELTDSAIQIVSPDELASITRTASQSRKRPARTPVSPPTLVGVMLADTERVDSVIAQLAAARSPILPADGLGRPLVLGADGHARSSSEATDSVSQGTNTTQRSAGSRAGASIGGGGLKGLYLGPRGEVYCVGSCGQDQVCCRGW